MNFIDMFAGIGGFRKGLESNGHQCVFSCELDNNAIKSYISLYHMNEEEIASMKKLNKSERDKTLENLRRQHIFDDITKFDGMSEKEISKIIPKYDVFCGGFPCQPFSRAGRRNGFKDKNKGNLFFSIANVVEKTRPRYVFLENVKGLLTSGEKEEVVKNGKKRVVEIEKGKTFKEILYELHELGYDVQWQMVSSGHYIAHNRERVYIVARKRGNKTIKRIFPLQENVRRINKVSFEKDTQVAYKDFINSIKSKTLYKFKIQENDMIDLYTNKSFNFNTKSPFGYWGIMVDGLCVTAKTKYKIAENEFKLIDVLEDYYKIGKRYDLSEEEVLKQRYAKKAKEWKSGNKMGNMAFPDKINKTCRTLTANASGREMMVIGYYFHEDGELHYINEIKEGLNQFNQEKELNELVSQCPIDSKVNNESNGLIIIENELGEEVHLKKSEIKFRKLTPREYWKLQGFDEEDFNRAKIVGVSDSQLKKQAGNAVTVDVIKAIGERL
ncbi:DNA cytosine methyltransferase [Sporosalibacterium faouarense]|uniref:DNA cytosine methyltransferase n=1 Tax=Sporosalibacterium faouarense TaxID=516123 RepID=UPI00192B24E0|nr:DNA (cytosine-5-)-methyltransferase [Sporosalibacterium faouarense]